MRSGRRQAAERTRARSAAPSAPSGRAGGRATGRRRGRPPPAPARRRRRARRPPVRALRRPRGRGGDRAARLARARDLRVAARLRARQPRPRGVLGAIDSVLGAPAAHRPSRAPSPFLARDSAASGAQSGVLADSVQTATPLLNCGASSLHPAHEPEVVHRPRRRRRHPARRRGRRLRLRLSRDDKIAKGVTVAGVDVGGMRSARQRERWCASWRSRAPAAGRGQVHGHAASSSAAAARRLRADVDGMVDEALDASRDGDDHHPRGPRPHRRPGERPGAGRRQLLARGRRGFYAA